MVLYDPGNPTRSSRHRTVHRRAEMVTQLLSLLAALCFITGSLLYLAGQLRTEGTLFFIAGSTFFALKPATSLVRELHFKAQDRRE